MNPRPRIPCAPLVLSFLLALLAAAPASAGIRWQFLLDGESAGTPSGAWGTADLRLNDAMTEVTYDIRLFSLQGPEIASHFHNGSPGNPGDRLYTLPMGNIKQGVWVLEGRDLTILLSGYVYVNVHTDPYPGGEIRGNATLDSVPVEQVTWSGVKALFR